MVSTPTSRAAVRRWWAASWGRVWRETQSPRCITGRMGKTDKSDVSTCWQPLLSPHGAPPLRTQMQRVSPASLGADASANAGAHASYPTKMPQKAAVATQHSSKSTKCLEDFLIPLWTCCLFESPSQFICPSKLLVCWQSRGQAPYDCNNPGRNQVWISTVHGFGVMDNSGRVHCECGLDGKVLSVRTWDARNSKLREFDDATNDWNRLGDLSGSRKTGHNWCGYSR